MAGLVDYVRGLMRNGFVRGLVDRRVSEFLSVYGAGDGRWFEELVFCILTANSSAETGIRCVEALKARGLIFDGSVGDVARVLREAGHRFWRVRAGFIVGARRWVPGLRARVLSFGEPVAMRRWLVSRIKGIGWKESSHFLRNVGILDVAIIDRHILRVMREYGLISWSGRTLTESRYLRYERILKGIAEELGIPVGVLDLYLWYMRTGKVLK